MKKNIILAIIGVVFMLGLVGCPNTPTSDFDGVWQVTGGSFYDDNKTKYDDWYIIIKDGKYCEMWWAYPLTYEITENTCNTIKTTDIYNYYYEKSGDDMTWKINTGSAIVDAAVGSWYEMKRVGDYNGSL